MPTGPDTSADALCRCANCGAALASPEAVCTACEAEWTPKTPDPTHGRYRCPAREARFDTAGHTLWPARVPWYKPQAVRPQCPHCQAVLTDRWFPPLSTPQALALLSVIFAVVYWTPAPLRLPLVVAAQVSRIVWTGIRSRTSGAETRYGAPT